jgi:hypothetical protein
MSPEMIAVNDNQAQWQAIDQDLRNVEGFFRNEVASLGVPRLREECPPGLEKQVGANEDFCTFMMAEYGSATRR